MSHKSYRDHSKIFYGNDPSNFTSLEQINCGSLQRIADATEKMAASYDAMRNDRDYWKGRAEREQASRSRADHSNRSLRGVITRRICSPASTTT